MQRMKWIMLVALVGIVVALASAGVQMLRRPTPSDASTTDASDAPNKGMATALAIRVGISVTLFIVVLLAWWLGWITPTGIPSGR
jgi:ABC-type phosphate transport system permease subunit